MVEDRPLNTIRPARYVRRLSLLRCSFILKSLFGTARGFYLWVSNGRANLNLLTTLLQLFTTNGSRRVPASHVRSGQSRRIWNIRHMSGQRGISDMFASMQLGSACELDHGIDGLLSVL